MKRLLLVLVWLAMLVPSFADEYHPGYWAGDIFGPDLSRVELLSHDVQLDLQPLLRRDYGMQHAALTTTYKLRGTGVVTIYVAADGFFRDHRSTWPKPALELDGKPLPHAECKPAPLPPWKLPDYANLSARSWQMLRERWSAHQATLTLTPGEHSLVLKQNILGTAVSADSPTLWWLFAYGFTPPSAWRRSAELTLSVNLPPGWQAQLNHGLSSKAGPNTVKLVSAPLEPLLVEAHAPAPGLTSGPWGVVTGGLGMFVMFIVLGPALQSSRERLTWYAALHAGLGAALGTVLFWLIGGTDSSAVLSRAGDQAAWAFQLPAGLLFQHALLVFFVSLLLFSLCFMFMLRGTALPTVRPLTIANLLPALMVAVLGASGVLYGYGPTLQAYLQDAWLSSSVDAAQAKITKISVHSTYTSRAGKNGPLVTHKLLEICADFEWEGKKRQAVSYTEVPRSVGESMAVTFPHGYPERAVIQEMRRYPNTGLGILLIALFASIPLLWVLAVTILDRCLRRTPLPRLFIGGEPTDRERRVY